MIFRNLLNKFKKQTEAKKPALFQPKKMNLGANIVELSRELNYYHPLGDRVYYYNYGDCGVKWPEKSSSGAVVFYKDEPLTDRKGFYGNVIRQNYSLIGFVNIEDEYVLLCKNIYDTIHPFTERKYNSFDEFKRDFIAGMDITKVLEQCKLKEIEKDFV